MATLTKAHPAVSAIGVENQVNVQFFTLTYPSDVSGKTGPESTQEAVKRAVGTLATIVGVGPLGNSDTEQTFMVEAASGSALTAGQLDAATDALGTVDSINCANVTATLKNLYIAV